MEKGLLGAVVPIDEGKDDLFGGLVIFHVIGQVAGGRHQIAGLEGPPREASFPGRTQADQLLPGLT